jgi:YVTN family beta-propeller protein
LHLSGAPSALLLKPDGGELYVNVPDSHGLEIINTWRTEISESMVLGLSPSDGTMTDDAALVYISDRAAGSVTPIQMATRHLLPPVSVGRHPSACALDPTADLLLVADEDSDDVAVIRVRTQSLATMIPVGSRPRSIAIKLF